MTSLVKTSKEIEFSREQVELIKSQIAKCAEALALRKAFPQELGGLYTMNNRLGVIAQEFNRMGGK